MKKRIITTILAALLGFSVKAQLTACAYTTCAPRIHFTNTDYYQIYQAALQSSCTFTTCSPQIPFTNTDLLQIYGALITRPTSTSTSSSTCIGVASGTVKAAYLGDTLLFRFPSNYSCSGSASKLCIFLHGVGGDYSSVPNNQFKDSLLSNGYVIASCTAYNPSLGTGNGWGNSWSQTKYMNLYNYALKFCNVTNQVYMISQSMGGLTAWNLIFNKSFPIAKHVALYNEISLDSAYTRGGHATIFRGGIEAAYSFTGSANLSKSTYGFDPFKKLRKSGIDTLSFAMPATYFAHGDLDTIASYPVSRIFYKILKNSNQNMTYSVSAGLGHTSTIPSAAGINNIMLWMADTYTFTDNYTPPTLQYFQQSLPSTLTYTGTTATNILTANTLVSAGNYTSNGYVLIDRQIDANVANFYMYSGSARTQAFYLATDQPNNKVIYDHRNSYTAEWQLNDAAKMSLTSTGLNVVDGFSTNGLATFSNVLVNGTHTVNGLATFSNVLANGTTSVNGLATFSNIIAKGTYTLRAGTTAAGTAPEKFVSGPLLTTPEVGAEEFLTDKRYTTITTGTARKEYALCDIALTSGRVPFSTTNGRLTDLAAFTYVTNRLSPTYITLAAGAAAAGSAPVVLTTGTSLTTPIAGALEYTTPQLFFTNGGALRQEIPQIQQSRVSSVFNATSNTTLANITGLTANVAAGKTYRIRAVLYTTSDATAGVKFAIGGTATATNIIYEGLAANAGTFTQTRAAALATAICAVTAVTAAYVIIEGTITVNTAGTLTVQFAQNVSNAISSTVAVGSNFQIQEIL